MKKAPLPEKIMNFTVYCILYSQNLWFVEDIDLQNLLLDFKYAIEGTNCHNLLVNYFDTAKN